MLRNTFSYLYILQKAGPNRAHNKLNLKILGKYETQERLHQVRFFLNIHLLPNKKCVRGIPASGVIDLLIARDSLQRRWSPYNTGVCLPTIPAVVVPNTGAVGHSADSGATERVPIVPSDYTGTMPATGPISPTLRESRTVSTTTSTFSRGQPTGWNGTISPGTVQYSRIPYCDKKQDKKKKLTYT